MRARIKLVCGVGTNDAEYEVVEHDYVGGRRVMSWICPKYSIWRGMLFRCYSESFKAKNPTYAECEVTPEWLRYSIFESWLDNQPWQGNDLDKDTLIRGNKLYSPETCIFISHALNSFLLDRGALRGEYPIGVTWHAQNKTYRAKCKNPFSKRAESLGLHSTPEAAHLAWKRRKNELANIYADMQTDQRIANALRVRYLPNTEHK